MILSTRVLKGWDPFLDSSEIPKNCQQDATRKWGVRVATFLPGYQFLGPHSDLQAQILCLSQPHLRQAENQRTLWIQTKYLGHKMKI